MDKYDQIKERNLKQNKLIDELRYAQDVESGKTTHELKRERGLFKNFRWLDSKEEWIENEHNYFHLIDIRKQQIVCSGTLKRLRSYCRIRNIKQDQIKYTGDI